MFGWEFWSEKDDLWDSLSYFRSSNKILVIVLEVIFFVFVVFIFLGDSFGVFVRGFWLGIFCIGGLGFWGMLFMLGILFFFIVWGFGGGCCVIIVVMLIRIGCSKMMISDCRCGKVFFCKLC